MVAGVILCGLEISLEMVHDWIHIHVTTDVLFGICESSGNSSKVAHTFMWIFPCRVCSRVSFNSLPKMLKKAPSFDFFCFGHPSHALVAQNNRSNIESVYIHEKDMLNMFKLII